MEPMNEEAVLAAITDDTDALDLLLERMPNAARRFNRLCRTMRDFLRDVQEHFPDAEYCTGGGGFNLLLGCAHDASVQAVPQHELQALTGIDVDISDGD